MFGFNFLVIPRHRGGLNRIITKGLESIGCNTLLLAPIKGLYYPMHMSGLSGGQNIVRLRIGMLCRMVRMYILLWGIY